jgi:methylthioribose-1-phosphate isomerase
MPPMDAPLDDAGTAGPSGIPPTIGWQDGKVRLIDQRQLPADLVFLEASTVDELCDAINRLAIRGAPALGVAGARAWPWLLTAARTPGKPPPG